MTQSGADPGRMTSLNETGSVGIHGPVQTGDNVVELHGDRETSATPRTFDDLFLDQHDRLYRALYFITGSSADAEELMQDAFLKLWERWDRIHAIEDPVGYLFRVTMNGFRMRARRARVAARRIVHFDADRAIGYLAPDANVDLLITSIGQGHDGPGLRRSIDWLKAVGYGQHLDSCQEQGVSATPARVRCAFDLDLLRSSEVDKGPYGPASIDFTIKDGKIIFASAWNWDYEKAFSSEMWGPFERFVTHRYSETDVGIMYEDETHSAASLTDASITRWEVYTQAYVRPPTPDRPSPMPRRAEDNGGEGCPGCREARSPAGPGFGLRCHPEGRR